MSCLEDCGNCCGLLSAIGIIFLLCLGAALDSKASAIDFKGDHSEAARNCYIAAVIYVVFLALSVCCIRKAKADAREEAEAAAELRRREEAEEKSS
mmetsp:Transcript_36240/g.58187  ORF Transcript_36240/g.58187 Transcript_36240/m.58187 type:complete len:96 (-) Transcript_36240:298-585(-)